MGTPTVPAAEMAQTKERNRLIVEAARKRPDWWMEKVLGYRLWVKQQEIVKSVFRNGRTAVRSCEGAGKSFSAAGVCLAFLCNYRPATVLTTAPTGRQVKDIIWKEIAIAHANAKIPLPGKVFKTKLDIDDKWFAMGFSTDQPEKFQGFHNENVLVIVDEASGVPEMVYQAIENPLSTGHTRLLLIGNPTQPIGSFRDAFYSRLYNHIHISAFDTPNFSSFGITIEDIRSGEWKEKLGDRELPTPYLVTPARVAERYEEWGEENVLFQSMVMGNFPDAGVNNLFPLHVIEKAMERQPDGTEEGASCVAALDVARYGDDLSVAGVKRGNVVYPFQVWGKQDTMQTTGRMARIMRDNKPIATRVDTVGVGGGVADRLKEVAVGRVEDVNVGSAAIDNIKFLNKRAEGYWLLLKQLENEEIILPNDPKLKAQLCDIRYKYTSKGQLQLESKEEMKSRGAKSPDLADCLMMLCLPLRRVSRQNIAYRRFN